MPRVTPPAFFSLLLGLVVSSAGAREVSEAVPEAWELITRHLPGDAVARMKKFPASGDREADFARAIIAMDTQPSSDARLRGVVSQLTELAGGDDEIARASAYFVGRVYQAHFFQPDYVRAAEAYESLATKHPESYWAQLALVKLALLKLYVLPGADEPARCVAAAEALLEKIKLPELQRDLHLVIARTRVFHGLPDVLPHLLAAEKIGGLSGIPRADLQIQIGELSRRAGDLAQAKFFFEKFMSENEVDARYYTVQMKIRAMAAGKP